MFTRHNDGRVTVDEWERETRMSQELLRQGTPELVASSSDDDLVTITVANGWARYRKVTGMCYQDWWCIYRLEESELRA